MSGSPFPGMDPYLEDRELWSGFHNRLLNSMSDQLVEILAPNYSVGIEERVYLSDPSDTGYPLRYPDLYVVARREHESQYAPGQSAIALPVHFDLVEEEVHDRFLVIRGRKERRIITAIELLSPTNKVPGSRGTQEFEKKRQELREGGANWIEIDLLRAGDRNPVVAGRSDYCVVLYRADRPGIDVWFIRLHDPLPRVAVPLKAPDSDAPLDLQQALDTAYRRGGYRYELEYGQAVPPPPLSPIDQAWVTERIAGWQPGS